VPGICAAGEAASGGVVIRVGGAGPSAGGLGGGSDGVSGEQAAFASSSLGAEGRCGGGQDGVGGLRSISDSDGAEGGGGDVKVGGSADG